MTKTDMPELLTQALADERGAAILGRIEERQSIYRQRQAAYDEKVRRSREMADDLSLKRATLRKKQSEHAERAAQAVLESSAIPSDSAIRKLQGEVDAHEGALKLHSATVDKAYTELAPASDALKDTYAEAICHIRRTAASSFEEGWKLMREAVHSLHVASELHGELLGYAYRFPVQLRDFEGARIHHLLANMAVQMPAEFRRMNLPADVDWNLVKRAVTQLAGDLTGGMHV